MYLARFSAQPKSAASIKKLDCNVQVLDEIMRKEENISKKKNHFLLNKFVFIILYFSNGTAKLEMTVALRSPEHEEDKGVIP